MQDSEIDTQHHPFRMDFKRAYIPLDKRWADPAQEEIIMHWLTAMLRPPFPRANGLDWRVPDGPFGPRDTGYRWQLDGSNDWWAEVQRSNVPAFMDNFTGPVLILACRYDYQPLQQLATWVAAKLSP